MLWIDVHKCLRCGIPLYRAPHDVLLSPGQDGWILPSYILWVQVTRTGQFVEAAKGQHLPATKAVREAIKTSGQRPPRQEREKQLANRHSIRYGHRYAMRVLMSYHPDRRVTCLCVPLPAQVTVWRNNRYEARISQLSTVERMHSQTLSLKRTMPTECTAAAGGGSHNSRAQNLMQARNSSLPWPYHTHTMQSGHHPLHTHHTITIKLHMTHIHTNYDKSYNFYSSWQINMPSPSSQSRSARRLPSRLRETQAQPTGRLLELREAAVAKAKAREQQGTPQATQAAPREEEPWWSYSYGPGAWSWSSWSPHSTEWQKDLTAENGSLAGATTACSGKSHHQDHRDTETLLAPCVIAS